MEHVPTKVVATASNRLLLDILSRSQEKARIFQSNPKALAKSRERQNHMCLQKNCTLFVDQASSVLHSGLPQLGTDFIDVLGTLPIR